MAAEAAGIDAVLGDFAGAEKDDRHVVRVFLAEVRVGIDVDLAERAAEFAEQGQNDGFGFVAEVTAAPGVERGVARPGEGEARGFSRVQVISAGNENLPRTAAGQGFTV